MHHTELIRTGVILRVCRLGRALQPLNALAIPLAQSHIASNTGVGHAHHGTRVVFRRCLTVELDCAASVDTTSPAEFVAKRCAVAGFDVAVFASCEEEREGSVVVFGAFAEQA